MVKYGKVTLLINTQDQKMISVALLKAKETIDSLSEENEYGSQVLLPLIIKILQKNQLDFTDLTEIKVAVGPGSYTGIRVGASIAQALGFALKIPVNGRVNKPVQLKYT